MEKNVLPNKIVTFSEKIPRVTFSEKVTFGTFRRKVSKWYFSEKIQVALFGKGIPAGRSTPVADDSARAELAAQIAIRGAYKCQPFKQRIS